MIKITESLSNSNLNEYRNLPPREPYEIDTLTPDMKPGGSYTEKTPEKALRKWVQLSVKMPTAVNLVCTKKSAEDLVQWINSDLDRVERIFLEEGADRIFRMDVMMDTIKNKSRLELLGYGDRYNVHPFTYESKLNLNYNLVLRGY